MWDHILTHEIERLFKKTGRYLISLRMRYRFVIEIVHGNYLQDQRCDTCYEYIQSNLFCYKISPCLDGILVPRN